MTANNNRINLDQGNGEYCDTCERVGLDLPVRVAIALADPSIKVCPAHLTTRYPALPEGLVYTLRLLEAGYLYTHSDGWTHKHFGKGAEFALRAYSVSENGYITAIPLDSTVEHPDVEKVHQQCFEKESTGFNKQSNSNVILSAIRLDFYTSSSDVGVLYTRHRLSNMTIEALEKKQKSFLVIPKGDTQHPRRLHYSEINLVQELANNNFKKAFPWIQGRDLSINNPLFKNQEILLHDVDFHYRDKELGDINNDYPIIVLDDPIGMAEDLLSIIRYLAEQSRDVEQERLYQSALNILALEASVKYQFFVEEFSKLKNKYKRKQIEEELEKNTNIPAFEQDSFRINRNVTLDMEFNTYDYTQQEIEKVNNKVDNKFKEEWYEGGLFRESYIGKYDEKAMISWMSDFNNKSMTDDKLESLVGFYVSILKSDLLSEYMQHGFDQKSKFSALNFLDICSRIIGESDGFEVVSHYFETLLAEEDYSNKKNYLLRLMTFDSKSIQEQVLQATAAALSTYQLTGVAFATSQLLDETNISTLTTQNKKINKVSEELENKVKLLSEQLGGSTARVIHKQVKNNEIKTTTIKSFETFSGKPVTAKIYQGTLKQVVQQVLKDYRIDYSALEKDANKSARLAKKNIQNHYLKNIQNMINDMFLSNPDFYRLSNKHTQLKLALFWDNNSNVYSGNQLKNAAQGAVVSASNFDIEQAQATKASTFARSSTGYGFGVFAFSLQYIGLLEALRGTSGKLDSTATQLAAVLSATIGNIADVFGRQLKIKVQMYGETTQSRENLIRLNRIMKTGLYGGAILLSSLEFYRAVGALRNQQTLLATLYATNGILIPLSTVFFVQGASMRIGLTGGWWGLISLVVLYGISVWINHEKRMLMQEYLSGSAWGITSENWSLSTEKVEYQKIASN